MNFVEAFLGFFLAFIAHDFYEVFFQSKIRKHLSKYKVIIEKEKGKNGL